MRSHIGFVSQKPFLFQGSILDNILLGRPSATRAEAVKAADDALVTEFVQGLPEGFDTPLGEGGANLSGGQQQRLALARCFLKDSEIIVLDEATSALDISSELSVQEALQRLFKNRIVIIVTHSLSALSLADKIILFDKGSIVAQGTHEVLIEESSLYQELYHQVRNKQDLGILDET